MSLPMGNPTGSNGAVSARESASDKHARTVGKLSIVVALSLVIYYCALPSKLSFDRSVAVKSSEHIINDDVFKKTATAVDKSVERWSSAQLKEWIEQDGDFSNKMEMLQRMPLPEGEDIEIYNLDAWKRLRSLLGFADSTTASPLSDPPLTVVLCANGGSVTSGSEVELLDRWDNVLVDVLRKTVAATEMISSRSRSIHMVNAAHGGRNSLHTAFCIHSFLPIDTNILIWEFSINDVIRDDGNCTETNNMLIAYLNQVEHYFGDNPPVVIMMYMWNHPFHLEEQGHRIHDQVFQCHDRLAANYNFVVGSIHLGTYLLNRIGWEFDDLKQHFLADARHPTAFGHFTLVYLLWELVTNTERPSVTRLNNSSLSLHRPTIKLECDNSKLASSMRDLLLHEQTFASWTWETPKNQHHNPGMIYATALSIPSLTKNSTALKTILRGNRDPGREDAKLSVALPCCFHDERVSFDLTEPANETSHGGRWVRAFSVYTGDFGNPDPTLHFVQVEVVRATSDEQKHGEDPIVLRSFCNSTLTNPSCMLGVRSQNTWLVLPEKTLISRMDFCNANHRCAKNKRGTHATLEYLALL